MINLNVLVLRFGRFAQTRLDILTSISESEGSSDESSRTSSTVVVHNGGGIDTSSERVGHSTDEVVDFRFDGLLLYSSLGGSSRLRREEAERLSREGNEAAHLFDFGFDIFSLDRRGMFVYFSLGRRYHRIESRSLGGRRSSLRDEMSDISPERWKKTHGVESSVFSILIPSCSSLLSRESRVGNIVGIDYKGKRIERRE